MHLRQQIKSVYFFLIFWLFLPLLAYTQQNINDIKVTVTFDSPPSTYTITKAPLKYDKTFALSLQVDDGLEVLKSVVFPSFETKYYSDGCGNIIPFTASSSLFCYQSSKENGPDLHDPTIIPFNESYLIWDDIKILYNNNYGIANHGVNSNDNTDPNFMNYSINRNRSFVRRKMFDVVKNEQVSNVFVCPSNIALWTQPAYTNGYNLVLNTNSGGPFGEHGGDVSNAIFNWSENQFIKRRQAGIEEPDIMSFTNQLLQNSVDGSNYWGSIFTHGFDVDGYPASTFNSDFEYIASNYGKDGQDNILVASDEEIYDYLHIRDAIQLDTSLIDNTLEITFSGNLPSNLRYYAISLVILANTNIASVDVSGVNDFSYNTSGLINFSWDGQVVPDPETLAENYVADALISGGERDAWIAMDYVYTLTPGSAKRIQLTEQLCNLDVVYEEGFCDIIPPDSIRITGDTIICLGESTILYATPGFDLYEWSTFEPGAEITVSPITTTQYSVRGLLNGVDYFDTVTVIVNSVPNIISHSESTISHIPGINDTLWVSTQDESLTYLWDDGSTDSTLIVDPPFSADYYVDVINTNDCSTRQEFSVKVNNTFDFTFDSVCFGGITHLENISSFPDSVIRVQWDLNSDGVFDDAEGDVVDYEFMDVGNHLVGMKSVLYPAGIDLTFHVVAVGDKPIPDFDVNGVCIPSTTNFSDNSTIVVGELTNWYWEFGDGGTDVSGFVSHKYSNPDQYNVKLVVSSNIGCKDSITKQIDIGESAEFVIIDADGNTLFANDTSWITKGDSLYVTIENATSYDSIIWDNEVRNAVYYVTNEGTFSVDVYSGPCALSRERILAFSGGGGGGSTTNEVMSLFTPNGDGFNDNWVVNDPNITAPFKVSIYNRYSNLVYESSDYQNDWQGTYNNTSLPQATYYYIIEDALGVIFKGPVTILR